MSNAQVTLAPVLQPPEMPKKTPPHHANEPDRPDAYSALVSMHADEPYLPLTEAVLRCHAKRRLFRALAQAGERAVAEWLFADPSRPFHQTPALNNSLFENSLAIRASQVTSSAPAAGAPAASGPQLNQRRPPHGPSVRPGDDLLLVPARASAGRMLGYSFGGLSRQTDASRECPIGDHKCAFPPHVVGRFAFSTATSDLVIVLHGLYKGCIAIMHMQGAPNSSERERNIFLVPPGNWGYHRLPGRIITNVRVPERRVPSMPRYQFGGAASSGGGDARNALAALERMVKGKFVSTRMCRDNFDDKSGEVLTREMRQVETEFDARDAVGMQVLRDLAVRMYFSYMSSVARGAASSSSQGHHSGSASGSSSRRP